MSNNKILWRYEVLYKEMDKDFNDNYEIINIFRRFEQKLLL